MIKYVGLRIVHLVARTLTGEDKFRNVLMVVTSIVRTHIMKSGNHLILVGGINTFFCGLAVVAGFKTLEWGVVIGIVLLIYGFFQIGRIDPSSMLGLSTLIPPLLLLIGKVIESPTYLVFGLIMVFVGWVSFTPTPQGSVHPQPPQQSSNDLKNED